MALRYFCNKCGEETPERELRAATQAVSPSTDVAIDVCPACAEKLESAFADGGRVVPVPGLARRPRLRGASSLVWLVLTSTWGAAAALVVFLDVDPVYRAPIALTFVLICPGLALVRLLRISGALNQLTVAVALSLALDVLVPAILLYAGGWSPPAALSILVGIATGAAVLEFFVWPPPASAAAK